MHYFWHCRPVWNSYWVIVLPPWGGNRVHEMTKLEKTRQHWHWCMPFSGHTIASTVETRLVLWVTSIQEKTNWTQREYPAIQRMCSCLYEKVPVRTLLEWRIQSWAPANCKDMDLMEKVKLLATRTMDECRGNNYTKRFLKLSLHLMGLNKTGDLTKMLRLWGA